LIQNSASSSDLRTWFENNVDDNGLLLNNNSFQLKNVSGGGTMYTLDNLPLPAIYQGGPVSLAYIMSPDKKYVFYFDLSQDGSDVTDQLQNYTSQIISTFKFIN
jgi:hypothetical protein